MAAFADHGFEQDATDHLGMPRELRRDRAAAKLAAGLAGYACGVDSALILRPMRGVAGVAFARQLAMYLTHVGFMMSLARVAIAFERDRSTVAHACHLIEDRRDDREFDAWIGSMESALRDAPQPRVLR